MTLMDAPTFNEARYRRNRTILYSLVGFLVAAFIASWFISGRPVDWPWNWWTHFMGRVTVSRFLDTVEHDDLQKAYAIWMHDPNWQQHQAAFNAYLSIASRRIRAAAWIRRRWIKLMRRR